HVGALFKCTNCGRAYGLDFGGAGCPVCGGILDLSQPLVFDPNQIDARERGLWRYRHSLPLPSDAEPVTLGEGGTPLLPVDVGGRTVNFKLEFTQPTGSFKDRGMAVMFT